MPPLPPRCTVCHDDFDANVIAFSARCGHLCCEDCTNFHFSFDGATPCPSCRKPIKREELFRLYFDYNLEEEGPAQRIENEEELAAVARGVTEACRQAVAGPSTAVDADDVRPKMEA